MRVAPAFSRPDSRGQHPSRLAGPGALRAAEKVIHTFINFAYGAEPSAALVADAEEEAGAGGETGLEFGPGLVAPCVGNTIV